MTHDAKWYRKTMLALEKQLTATDRNWFTELREYTTLGAVMRDETAVDTQLYAMMTDLLAAEQAGDDAISLFGKEPKKMADELLKLLPPARWQSSAKLAGMIVGIIWLVMLISGGMAGDTMVINPLSYLVIPVFTAVMVFGIFAAIRSQIYATVRLLKSHVVGFLIIWAIMFLYIGTTLAIVVFMPAVAAIQVPFPWDTVVVAVATAVACWLALRTHDQLFTPMAFMAAVIGAVTIFRLWWQTTKFAPRWVMGVIVVAITLTALIIYTLWMRKAAKNIKD